MFENPGQKIKTWANAVFVIGLILSIIGGIVIMAAGSGSYYRYSGGGGFLSGLLVMGLGCLGSFLSSLLLYAVGTLVEAAESADRRLEHIENTTISLNAELTTIRKAIAAQGEQTAAKSSPDNTAATPKASFTENPVVYHSDTASKSSPQPLTRLPEHYVIIDRSKSSYICPVCGTRQPSNFVICTTCKIAFVDKLTQAELNAASVPPPDNSAFQVRVDRSGLSLRCPMCSELQPSNLARCQKCKAQFADPPK